VRAPCTPAPPVRRGGRSDFASLVEVVCAKACVSEEELRSRRRTGRIARAYSALALRASRELGVSASELARRLGVTPSAVSRMLDRARRW
jgi:ribosome-binding protein aMBF1 (putative translation factor)